MFLEELSNSIQYLENSAINLEFDCAAGYLSIDECNNRISLNKLKVLQLATMYDYIITNDCIPIKGHYRRSYLN